MTTLGGQVLLFGGYDTSTMTYLNDTWTSEGTSWTQLSVSNPPAARSGTAMAALGNEVVLFGGANGSYQGDTWTFDGTSWTQLGVSNPPPARDSATMAFLP
jgi:N-acetylneuraminic acid mutarotase